MARLILVYLTAIIFIMVPFGLYADDMVPYRLVNAPTAGTLSGRTYFFETHLFDGGGVTQRIGIGVADLLDIGVSYSGSNIIGSRRVNWQPHAGFQVRVRIVEESIKHPAIAIGVDTQGESQYLSGENLNRFRVKSKGAYLAISRNYNFLGDLGFHGGANYSFENDDGDYDPSLWLGIDKNIGRFFSLCCEYDFAINDNEDESLTYDRGYLNAAVKLNLGGAFTLEFDLQNILRNAKKDLFGNTQEKPQPSREIRLRYTNRF